MRGQSTGIAVLLAGALAAPPAAADPDCICRAQGRTFHLGETVCLATPNGPRRATCGMMANVTSWKVSGESCVVAVPQPPALQSAAFTSR
ncbi:MAG: hypothetical protein AB7O50_07765 [Pseudolabrys sp.]